MSSQVFAQTVKTPGPEAFLPQPKKSQSISESTAFFVGAAVIVVVFLVSLVLLLKRRKRAFR